MTPAERRQMRREFNRELAGYDPIRELACRAVGLEYREVRCSNAGCSDKPRTDAQAHADAGHSGHLPKSWEMIEGNALGKQVIEYGRYAAPGQTKANGRPLAALR